MEKIRLAQVIGRFGYGGLEQVVYKLLTTIDRDRFECHLIALRGADEDWRDRLPQGVMLHPLAKRVGVDFSMIRQLSGIFRREGIQVVHSHNWETWLYCCLAAKLARVPVSIHTEHGRDTRDTEDSFRQSLAKRLLCRMTNRLTAVSPDIAEIMIREWRAPAEKVSVIVNGVPIPERLNESERIRLRGELGLPERFLLGTVIGVIRPVKDVPTLLRALSIVLRKVNEVTFILVGGSNQLCGSVSSNAAEREVQELVAELKLSDHVIFTGPKPEVQGYHQAFDLYVNSSLYEGTSMAIADSMAAGVPVVATDVGGTHFLLRHRETGWLVPPRNPEAIANAIMTLINSAELRSELSDAARKKICAEYELGSVTRRYENIYQELLGARNRRKSQN